MEIISTRQAKPPRMLLYGEGGCGKSTLCAAFPDPIFMDIEGGLETIDTKSLPRPKNFDEVLEQLTWLYKEKHTFKTLVIDSLDHLENIINSHVCKNEGVSDISDIGYGGGYAKSFGHFERVMKACSAIRDERNMAIVLICHGQTITYNNPTGADFDKWAPKLREKSWHLFFEWATIVSFLHLKINTKKVKSGFSDKEKGIGGTQRVLSCYPAAGWTAKNRYGIENDIPLTISDGYKNLTKAIKGEK